MNFSAAAGSRLQKASQDPCIIQFSSLQFESVFTVVLPRPLCTSSEVSKSPDLSDMSLAGLQGGCLLSSVPGS